MAENHEQSGNPAGGISMLSAEIVVALVLLAIGSLVVYDSHRLGSSWGSDGPEAGYFPFYIGLFICISSAVTLTQALFGKTRKRKAVFVEWQPLRQVLVGAVAGAGVRVRHPVDRALCGIGDLYRGFHDLARKVQLGEERRCSASQ